jgi:hypothetical protein
MLYIHSYAYALLLSTSKWKGTLYWEVRRLTSRQEKRPFKVNYIHYPWALGYPSRPNSSRQPIITGVPYTLLLYVGIVGRKANRIKYSKFATRCPPTGLDPSLCYAEYYQGLDVNTRTDTHASEYSTRMHTHTRRAQFCFKGVRTRGSYSAKQGQAMDEWFFHSYCETCTQLCSRLLWYRIICSLYSALQVCLSL